MGDVLSGGSAQESGEKQDLGFETVGQGESMGRKRKRGNAHSDDDSSSNSDGFYSNDGRSESESDDEQRAHTLAMGQLIAFSHARAKELIDASYNRYSWNDADDLPEWFVEDEKEHNRPQMPVTREMVQASRRRFLELSKAPIKKVAEARARKKMRMVKAMEKAKRLANKIAEDTDLSTRSKMRAIEKAMNKSRVKKTGSVTVRVTKGRRKALGGKKSGVKVKFADKRMRSDERGLKRAAKAKGRKGTKRFKKGRRTSTGKRRH